MWIFLFPVAVISMILLLMYENDRHTLKRNMARGRCGLPGMPNKNFFQKKDNECEADEEKEPFEKEFKVLKTDLNVQRKQIEETRERVVDADKQLLTLNTTAVGMKKKYDMIMFMLKEDLLDAEEEYKLLNKKMASANELRQKFYSLENECEGMNKPDNCASAASCAEKSLSRRSSNKPPEKLEETTRRSSCSSQSYHTNRGSSCCSHQSNTNYDDKPTDVYSSHSGVPSNTPPNPCNKYPRPPCCPPPKPALPPPNPCHPPIKRPRRTDACERPGVPFCCKYPAAPDYGFPPQRCPKPHKNCQQPSLGSNQSLNDSNSMSSSLAVRKTSTSIRNNSNSPAVRNSPFPNKDTSSQGTGNSCCSQTSTSYKDKSSQRATRNSSRSNKDESSQRSGGSCCSSRKPSPQRSSYETSYENMRQYPGKPDPCAPPTYCPGRSACACCKCEPPAPKCPPSQLIKMQPFSTFFGERMPVKQCTTVKQTVYSEGIGDDESDNVSYDTQVITEVTTSKCSFPPKCCMSVYEDFRKNNNVVEPTVKLPVFVDPCDPCAEKPREISPFEDIVNISHTCGTQTNNGDSQSDEKCCPSYPLRKTKIIP